ncbi:MAG: tetratricopeptide repeat protein [Sphingobium sp.]
MSLLIAALWLGGQAYDPETEAIMRRRKQPAQAAVAPAAAPVLPVPAEMAAPFQSCLDAAAEAPDKGIEQAQRWHLAGGGFYARHCMGFAYAQSGRWATAAIAFQQAADEAELAGQRAQAARLWGQAGNAALAASDFARARTDFDAGLAIGVPDGLEKGELHLDRARALVALADLPGARESLDVALDHAPNDPLAWLLSATLARRMDQMGVAQAHIARAVALSPDDASVALEEGNIAILTGHEDIARSAWQRAVRLAPDTPAAKAASENLGSLPPEPSARPTR